MVITSTKNSSYKFLLRTVIQLVEEVMMEKNFVVKIKIYYEDTAAAGVVFYPSYLRFMERSKADFFQNIGMPLEFLTEKGIFIPIKEMHVRYFNPAYLGDELNVEVSLSKLDPFGFYMTHTISRGKDNICEGILKYASVTSTFKKTAFPAWLLQSLTPSSD